MKKRVLCLLIDGFEEIEAVTPIDLLCRAGAEVTTASLMSSLSVKGRSGLLMQADVLLDEVAADQFDVLFLPGGPGVKAMREDGRAAALARQFSETEKLVTAICAAPTILHDAGLLAGKKFTAHFSVHGELPDALGAERVVRDGLLITSRGAGTALDFGLEIVRFLYGAEEAEKVSASIMA